MSVFAIGSEILLGGGNSGGQQFTSLAGGGAVVTWFDNNQNAGDPNGLGVLARVFAADGTPAGNRFLVNTIVAGNQGPPQVTALSNGGFVIAWQDTSLTAPDTSVSAVRAQVFNSAGGPVGTEILVNTATAGAQNTSQITALSTGGFVVAWRDQSHAAPDTTGDAVRAQVFDAAGAQVGTEILVNTTTEGDQNAPQITALSNGRFVVAWQDTSHTAPDTTGFAVRAQVFTDAGAPMGTEILVNTATAGDQNAIQIIALSNDGFVVAWVDASLTAPDTTGAAVRAQVFTAAGTPAGTEILVNTATAGAQNAPQITALSTGGFVVTWTDASLGVGGATGDASSSAVKAQVFTAAGLADGGEILVNTATAGAQQTPDVVALSGGRFVIAWTDNSRTAPDTTDGAVRVQVFDAHGTRLGTEILVNTTTTNFQGSPQIAALGEGFIVAWKDAINLPSAGSVDAQVFGISNSAPAGADALVSGSPGDPKVLSAANFGLDDVDGDGLAAVKITTLPTSGTLQDDGVAVTAGQSVSVAHIAAGKLVFTPATGDASFTFQVQDDGGVANGGVDLDPSANTLTIDITPPTAASATTPAAGTYVAGGHLDFTVKLGEAVTVDTGGGRPYVTLALDTGGAVHADYLSGSGGDTLTFRYAVASGNLDADGIQVTSGVVLNGGAIHDAAGNAASFTGLDFGTTSGVRVDAEAPSVAISAPAASLAAGATTTLTFTFSEAPVGFTAGDIAVTGGAVSNFAATADPKVYTATFTPAGSGSSATVSVAGAGFTDAAANPGADAAPLNLTINVAAAPPPPAPPPITGGTDGTGGSDTALLGSDGNVFHAGAGADVVSGGGGDDVLHGDAGADTVSGGVGADSVYGDDGNDLLTGDEGADYLRGGNGDDVITGGTDFDDLNGNEGNDTLSGGDGDDWVLGGKDNDSLSGQAGDDIVYGNLGKDTCLGGAGADTLRGGQDNDLVLGGDGNDWLAGDRGSDTLTGGAGADIFHTFGDAGLDVVTDFHASEGDRVYLLPGTAYTTGQIGADTVITLTGGGRMILENVQLSSLTSGWIFS